MALACISCSKRPYGTAMPFDVNKRLIIDEKCDLAILSWNKHGYYNPMVIENAFSENYNMKEVMPYSKRNLYANSISCDCRYVSMGRIPPSFLRRSNHSLLISTFCREKLPQFDGPENRNMRMHQREIGLSYFEWSNINNCQ